MIYIAIVRMLFVHHTTLLTMIKLNMWRFIDTLLKKKNKKGDLYVLEKEIWWVADFYEFFQF